MKTDVQVETEIARPRAEVAAYVTDWRNDQTWIRALSDVRLVTDGPVGVGSQVERVASFLGKRIEYVNERSSSSSRTDASSCGRSRLRSR